MSELQKYECKDFSDIAKCFEKLHLHINTEVEMLKVKQEETEKRMGVIDNQIEFMNGELQDIHGKHIPGLDDKLEKESNERLKLELWGRKWNLIIRGLSGQDGEPPKTTQTVVRVFLNTKLGFDTEHVKNMLFTAVHRLPSGPTDKRNVILRLSNLIDRDEILMTATKLPPGSGFSVVPDLPPILASRRGELLRERSAMSVEERRKYRLAYLKESPFLQLVRKKSTR